MIDTRDVTGVILCGGEGRRMHGQDKPLQMLAGLTLVEHVRARLKPQVARVIISANRNVPSYRAWGDTVLEDKTRGLGPLGGLLTALEYANTPYLFCCPGDTPLLPLSLVQSLAQTLSASNADVCFPHDGERQQTLFLLAKISSKQSLRIYLDNGGRSVREWVSHVPYVEADLSHEHASFLNINTEQERIALQYRLLGVESPI